MVTLQNTFVCSEVQAVVRDMLGGQEEDLTDRQIMVKWCVSVRKIGNKSPNRYKLLDLPPSCPQYHIQYPFVFWLIEFTVPSLGMKDSGESRFIAKLVRKVDLV